MNTALQNLEIATRKHLRDHRYARQLMDCLLVDKPQGAAFSLEIHEDDQMLLHSLSHHGDIHFALSQYFNVSQQQYNSLREIAKLLDANLSEAEFLDFACGYGRLIRFLKYYHPAIKLHASEIQTKALQFLSANFDVKTAQSTTEPQNYQFNGQPNFIWVASLFSHLPKETFKSWLKKLFSLLGNDGFLCFSIRDVALMAPGKTLDHDGLLFESISETNDLAVSDYGTTYVNEEFVKNALAEAAGEAWPYFRLQKALAHEQDLYIVCANKNRDLSKLAHFRRGPWGWVDMVKLEPSGLLVLEGWSASLDDGMVEQVDIEINDVCMSAKTGRNRGDVEAAFNDSRMKNCGWRFECQLKPTAEARVCVTVKDKFGAQALLYCGVVTAANH